MPPKSTWLEPKPADGLVSHMPDQATDPIFHDDLVNQLFNGSQACGLLMK